MRRRRARPREPAEWGRCIVEEARGERPPPRVLIVWPEQWPRANLRVLLREGGYDAVGVRDLGEALGESVREPGRGAVRLLVIDQAVLPGGSHDGLDRLLAKHGQPPVVLLAPGMREAMPGPWARVVRRPFTVGQVVAVIRELLPPGPWVGLEE